MSSRIIINLEGNNPRSYSSHCNCHYGNNGEFCGVCGKPYINFPDGGSFKVSGNEEVAWRCVVWAASRGGSFQSEPFTNRRGCYRVVYEGGNIFREHLHPNGIWSKAGWYTNQ